MLLFLFIGFLLVLYAFFSYKKAFIAFIAFSLILNQNINLVNLPGLPLLTLNLSLCLIFWGLFLFKRTRIDRCREPFPLKTAMLLLVGSVFLSSLVGLAGPTKALPSFIGTAFEDYIMVWLVWVVIKDEKDYAFLLKMVGFVILISCVYGLYEAFTHTNPLIDYEINNAGNASGKVVDFRYDEAGGRGYRVQSLFSHAIGAGMIWMTFFVMVVYLYSRFKRAFKIDYAWYLALGVFCAFCAFTTNSRSPIFFMIVCMLPLFNIRKKQNLMLLGAIVVFACILFSYNSGALQNLTSLFDSSAQAKVGGSDAAQRLLQLNAAFEIFREHMWFGIGPHGMEFYHDPTTIDSLLGLESMWLRTIVEQGLIGVLATLFLIYTLVFKLGIFARNYLVFFLSAAFFMTSSMTSLPGFSMCLFYAFLFMLIKFSRRQSSTPGLNSLVIPDE